MRTASALALRVAAAALLACASCSGAGAPPMPGASPGPLAAAPKEAAAEKPGDGAIRALPPPSAAVGPAGDPAATGAPGASNGAPLVSGAERPPPSARAERIYVAVGLEPIRLEPRWDAPVIGQARAGQSLRTRGGEPAKGPSVSACAGGWYAVEPRGYVCVGRASTLDANDPRVLAAAEVLPDTASPLPFRVGVSIGAPIYQRFPTREEQRKAEPGLDAHLARVSAGGAGAPKAQGAPDDAEGGAIDPRPAADSPSEALLRYFAVRERGLFAKRDAFAGMRVAWAREIDAEGRTWLVTPDLGLIPKDKVRTKPTPTLRGLRLGPDGVSLPVAFAWLDPVPKARLSAGQLVETGETWPRHAFIPVTDEMRKGRSGFFVEARDGSWLRRDRVTVIKAASSRPRGVGPRDKWIQVRITHGYLVAYEGDVPVYATAVSPGIDGIDPRRHASPTGSYRVYVKAVSWDMAGVDKSKEWMVAEVPWVGFYLDSYAVHGAWWHDDFGRPKSHGCINLPPADAREIFAWMDPPLPEGWYAVGAYYPHVPGTVVQLTP